jgi:hypothetical protein
MDGSTIVAIVAAVIAAASALFSMQQAKHAKSQARAAQAQVTIMQQQVAGDEADRNRQDAPVIHWDHRDGYTGQVARFVATVLDSTGPIILSVAGIAVWTSGEDVPRQLAPPSMPQVVAPGARIEIPVSLSADQGKKRVRVDIQLMCTEQAEPKRSWTISRSIEVPDIPRPSEIS